MWALSGLGATQIICYGTLYYCLSILGPDIAHDFAVSEQWVFEAFSLALLIGAFAAGGGLPQMWLAVIAAVLMPIGVVILLSTIPWFAGAVLFAICMGLGSGLTSIVGGTLPLELFGRNGYGSRLGWCTSAKQITSAIAPVLMSMSMAGIGVHGSLWVVTGAGLAGAGAFALIPFVLRDRTAKGNASYNS